MQELRQEVPFNQAPQWLKEACANYTDKGFRTLSVVITNRRRVPSNWHDSNVRRIVLHSAKGQTVVLTDYGYESAINDPLYIFGGAENGTFNIGEAIATIDGYPHKVTLYTPSFGLPAQLTPAPITDREALILSIFRGLISTARPKYLLINRVRQAELDKLEANGYLKRNAITTMGKNALANREVPHYATC